jgi:hypothetical protein
MLVLLENGGECGPIREGRNRVTRAANGVRHTDPTACRALPRRSRLKAF